MAQNVLFRDKDDVVDKMKVQSLFNDIYEKLLKRVQSVNLHTYHKEVRLLLKQSNQLR